MATQSASVSCADASIVAYGNAPPAGGELDHIILFDFLAPGNTAWIQCGELKNHFLIESDPIELDADLIQSAFIGIISLWAIGVGMGLIISLIRKLRV